MGRGGLLSQEISASGFAQEKLVNKLAGAATPSDRATSFSRWGEEMKKTDTVPSRQLKDTGKYFSRDSLWSDRKALYLYDNINKDSANPFPAFPQFYFSLSGFAAKFTDSAIIIHWTADINENVRWFIIERSIDGRNFYMAGEIDLTGKWNHKDFTFLDKTGFKKPRYYYQIKALLGDGSSMTSKTIIVTNLSHVMRVWFQTNDVNGEKELMADKAVKKIEIMDVNSKIVFRSSHIKLPFRIPYEKLKAGTFAIKVFSENDFVTQVLIKK